MITFLLGLPGSGKTAYAVDRIFHNFSTDEEAKKDKKVSFQNCYTNINQFQFDKVENTYPLDFDELLVHLTTLYTMYKAKKPDEDLLKYLEENQLKDTLFVIDEAHNFFDTKNRILVWWLSYHRHLHHEIILITQSLSLIETKYKSFSEYFYVAKPQSLRLFSSTFKYNRFTHSRMAKASSVGAIKLKQNPKVFALYHSGDSVDTPNMALKYILTSVGLLIAIVLFFKFVISPPSVEAETELKTEIIDTKNETVKIQNKVNTQNTIIEDEENQLNENEYKDKTYLKLSCSKQKCNDEIISIPPQLLRIFINNKDFIILYAENINQNLTIYHLETKTEFYNYIQPKKKRNYEDENQKDNKDTSVTSGFNMGFGSPSK